MRFFTNQLSAAVILLSLVASSCKNDTSNFGPDPPNLLVNSEFEINGQPSFYGWSFSGYGQFQFSTDKPVGASGQSALLTTSVNPPGGLMPGLNQVVPASPGKHVYRLSYWAKSIPKGWYVYGFALFFVGDSEFYSIWRNNRPDTVWTFYSAVSDTIDVQKPDVKIKVLLIGSDPSTVPVRQYFHDPKLELLN